MQPPVSTDRLLAVTRSGAPGLSYAELRGRRFASPTRGVRIDTTVPASDCDDVAAAVMGAVSRAVVTDVDAARLWRLPLPHWLADPDERPISIAVNAGTAGPQRRGVRGDASGCPTSM